MRSLQNSWRFWIAATLLATPAACLGQIFTWSDRGDAQNNPWLASMVYSAWEPIGCQNVANRLLAHPPGKRCLLLWHQAHAVFNNPADGIDQYDKIYWPAGIAEAKRNNINTIAALTAASVKPDVVILDDEDSPGSYTMSDAQLAHAENDPHYSDFDWPALPLLTTSARCHFDELLGNLVHSALNEGVLCDFEQYAPNALTTGAAERLCTPEEAVVVPDFNGNPNSATTLSGNSQSPAAALTAAGFAPTHVPFSLIIYGTNMLRVSVRHSPVLPWYGSDVIGGGSSLANTGYWEEFLRHGVLTCGVRGQLFDPGDGDTAAARFSTVLFDMYKVCNGALPQLLLTTQTSETNAQWFASARVDKDAGGMVTRIVARVSFAPGVTKAKVVIAGQTFNVTRPTRQVGAWIRWNRQSTASLY